MESDWNRGMHHPIWPSSFLIQVDQAKTIQVEICLFGCTCKKFWPNNPAQNDTHSRDCGSKQLSIPLCVWVQFLLCWDRFMTTQKKVHPTQANTPVSAQTNVQNHRHHMFSERDMQSLYWGSCISVNSRPQCICCNWRRLQQRKIDINGLTSCLCKNYLSEKKAWPLHQEYRICHASLFRQLFTWSKKPCLLSLSVWL